MKKGDTYIGEFKNGVLNGEGTDKMITPTLNNYNSQH